VPGEELDLTDEEIEEMIRFSQEYGSRQRMSEVDKAKEDVSKEVDKAITETRRENKGGIKGTLEKT
jgi:hypothetical protein